MNVIYLGMQQRFAGKFFNGTAHLMILNCRPNPE